jgi:hypothetical protein
MESEEDVDALELLRIRERRAVGSYEGLERGDVGVRSLLENELPLASWFVSIFSCEDIALCDVVDYVLLLNVWVKR